MSNCQKVATWDRAVKDDVRLNTKFLIIEYLGKHIYLALLIAEVKTISLRLCPFFQISSYFISLAVFAEYKYFCFWKAKHEAGLSDN